MIEQHGILTDDDVDLTHFEPEYMERLRALFFDPRIRGKYYVESGSRSRAKQTELYKAYRAGRGNLAAKPGTSDHEYDSPPNHVLARATDIHPIPGKGGNYAELHNVAREFGFYFNISSERWHMVLRPGRGPLPAPAKPVVTEEEEMPQCEWNDGAIAVVNAKGEVFCPKIPGRPVAKHYGGMTQLRDEVKRSFTKATVIAPVDRADSQAGYFILDESWGFDDYWKFEPGVEKYFK